MNSERRRGIKVHLLGEFYILSERGTLNESKMHSDMLTKLLSYVIINRGRDNTIEELTAVLWPNDISNNPSGALKNLMYRLRTLLAKVWNDRGEYILTGRGFYKWNPDVDVEVDAERFEALCDEIQTEEDMDRRIEYGLEAATLYRDHFLKDYANERWVAQRAARCRNRYTLMIRQLLGDLTQLGRHAQIEQTARAALDLEPLDEAINLALLAALIHQSKHREAAVAYSWFEERLYDALGVRPPEKMQEMYAEMMRHQHPQECDIAAIVAGFEEEEAPSGAFYCEYGTFRHLYQLESRQIGRLGMPVYLCLVTMHPQEELEPDSVDYRLVINRGMGQLKEVILQYLRYGDAVTRYSVNQYLILLPCCQYEDASAVLARITSRFYQIKKHADVDLKCSYQEMVAMKKQAEGSDGPAQAGTSTS